MPGVKLTTQAYCKMLLHGAKYPHCAVNGLLVAEKQKPRKDHLPLGGPGAPHTLFVDCIPLFHGTLALAPMLEVALTLIDSWCKDNSYVIAGYYQANERVKDARLPSWGPHTRAELQRSPPCLSASTSAPGEDQRPTQTRAVGEVPTRSRRRWPPGSPRASSIPCSSWWTTPSSPWTVARRRSTCTSTTRTGGGAETRTMTTVRTGRRHRGSQHHCWTAGPTRRWWISTTTWTTFETTGQTPRSTRPSCTCARRDPGALLGVATSWRGSLFSRGVRAA
ncbi:PREDICTED: ER membrane protein complex subunit 8 isoform X1 [Chinchilla lanigera]|uniref:ER membrane protein complex subunit 8 isoform X1 n=1 Tax=Chinchilla lanigera TaxID=34839 RepID=UPI000697F33D|nr:PREDICTED: ER membrane protein complex subunit 8 isoform X1 [Chinchilla lanigera]